MQGGREQGRGDTPGCGEGLGVLGCPHLPVKSRRDERFAVSWCRQKGPAGHLGVCSVAGSQLGGGTGTQVLSTCKSPLP